jgi:two-component system sensor histidine kinase BarA
MAESAFLDSVDELTLGKGAPLEELVDRTAIEELAKSFYDLFRVPLRIFAEDGKLLADATHSEPLYTYLSTLKEGRRAVQAVVDQVKSVDPGVDGDEMVPCVTGAAYRVVSISYDGRQLGRMIFGPFLPLGVKEMPQSLVDIDPALDREEARTLLGKMPRARQETVGQIANHLRRTLDLILFSGHKALLTSKMHLASVRESYHELEAKNRRLQEAYDRLKELDRLKSNFLATVSHELRTPLTSIIGYSEMLKEGIAGELSGEQAEFVETIREKGEQLLELIKSLLDLSKLESGTMGMRKSRTNLGEVVRDVHATLTPTAHKKGVKLVHEMAETLPPVWGDAERLRQVFLNLGENAIKFTPEGGTVAFTVVPTLMNLPGDDETHALFSNAREGIEVRVSDTGIGIPDAERSRVFDAFYQVDSSSTREQGGTGLGLSIVKRLVEGHDGLVRIEVNEPHGAVFVVTLPCARSNQV